MVSITSKLSQRTRICLYLCCLTLYSDPVFAATHFTDSEIYSIPAESPDLSDRVLSPHQSLVLNSASSISLKAGNLNHLLPYSDYFTAAPLIGPLFGNGSGLNKNFLSATLGNEVGDPHLLEIDNPGQIKNRNPFWNGQLQIAPLPGLELLARYYQNDQFGDRSSHLRDKMLHSDLAGAWYGGNYPHISILTGGLAYRSKNLTTHFVHTQGYHWKTSMLSGFSYPTTVSLTEGRIQALPFVTLDGLFENRELISTANLPQNRSGDEERLNLGFTFSSPNYSPISPRDSLSGLEWSLRLDWERYRQSVYRLSEADNLFLLTSPVYYNEPGFVAAIRMGRIQTKWALGLQGKFTLRGLEQAQANGNLHYRYRLNMLIPTLDFLGDMEVTAGQSYLGTLAYTEQLSQGSNNITAHRPIPAYPVTAVWMNGLRAGLGHFQLQSRAGFAVENNIAYFRLDTTTVIDQVWTYRGGSYESIGEAVPWIQYETRLGYGNNWDNVPISTHILFEWREYLNKSHEKLEYEPGPWLWQAGFKMDLPSDLSITIVSNYVSEKKVRYWSKEPFRVPAHWEHNLKLTQVVWKDRLSLNLSAFNAFGENILEHPNGNELRFRMLVGADYCF